MYKAEWLLVNDNQLKIYMTYNQSVHIYQAQSIGDLYDIQSIGAYLSSTDIDKQQKQIITFFVNPDDEVIMVLLTNPSDCWPEQIYRQESACVVRSILFMFLKTTQQYLSLIYNLCMMYVQERMANGELQSVGEINQSKLNLS